MVRLDSTDQETIELTEIFRLPDIDEEINVPLAGLSRTVTIERDLRASRRRTDPLAFCFHGWCYEVLQWKTNGCSKSVIFKLARTLMLDPAIWVSVSERRQDLDSAGMLQLAAAIDRSLFLSKLPPELKSIIWRDTGLATPHSAFVIVAYETSRLARSLRRNSSRCILLEQGSRISAEMISVFGINYLRDLNVNRKSEGSLVGDITEVKFTSSLFGICAIQLLGNDWKTDWIGNIPNADYAWYGMIRGRVLSLQFDYNVSY